MADDVNSRLMARTIEAVQKAKLQYAREVRAGAEYLAKLVRCPSHLLKPKEKPMEKHWHCARCGQVIALAGLTAMETAMETVRMEAAEPLSRLCGYCLAEQHRELENRCGGKIVCHNCGADLGPTADGSPDAGEWQGIYADGNDWWLCNNCKPPMQQGIPCDVYPQGGNSPIKRFLFMVTGPMYEQYMGRPVPGRRWPEFEKFVESVYLSLCDALELVFKGEVTRQRILERAAVMTKEKEDAGEARK